MCFDTSRIETLQNCRYVLKFSFICTKRILKISFIRINCTFSTFWQQQIQKFCPDTPIILVGCKNDLRWVRLIYLANCFLLTANGVQ